MKVRAVVQARMLSSRLRGKSLLSVAGQPLLGRVLHRIQAMSFVHETVVATTLDAADEPIVALVTSRGIRCVRGERSDLLARFLQAACDLDDNDVLVRFTADNPLYDPTRSAAAWRAHSSGEWDYTHVDGLSHMVPEFIRVGALRKIDALTADPFDREHVTPCLRKQAQLFRVQVLPADFASLRADLDKHLTIDSQADLERFERMFYEVERPGQFLTLDDCYLWLDRQKTGLLGPVETGPRQLRMTLAGHEVGDGCPCFIIAEIGQNHNGQIGMAKRLIEMARRCGVDAVKFQKRDIRWELTEDAYNRPYDHPNSFAPTYGQHREFLELSEAQHKELREYALACGLVCFCTACDEPSVELMQRVGNPIYKVASRDITNIPLLRAIAQTGKPVILSTGMAGLDEIREALDALAEASADKPQVMLMQCVSQYPAEEERLNLRAMETMRKEFGLLVGLSDHTPGVIGAVAGAVLGAPVIEKHITLSRAMQGTDHAAALEEEDLRKLVQHVRACGRAMGDGRKVFDPAVESARQKLSRSLTSRLVIPAGTTLTEAMLVLKSPGTGLSWRERSKIVGKRATRDIAADRTLNETDFA
ncbi:MAG: N,N'-diacetyllegionaminic acid synthase [Planctomycetes bacterium ADurb.Bin126]|nr:MAG: N,N'-diacetyllegionaminic acid synthase [Planctomycetes bacterium ADurb.Bin126]HOD83287.1 N-acetylneuraminate synthase family protein [Phycisphaerae bacterium]HQL73163.1 N-acetylneuraminate synthase family protein [Phycisphaerae bacterium]